MTYTVQKLADLAGISVRTLHHYDEIGLLKPSAIRKNGYREYGADELLRLQQILFFRELEFPLDDIKRILSAPNFDMRRALHDHRAMIELKRKRLNGLLKTIDKTLLQLEKKTSMDDKELYNEFDKEKLDAYAKEAKERWGNTEAWRQSQERTKHWTKEDYKKLKEGADLYMKTVAAAFDRGIAPDSAEAQELIAEHYNALRTFYEPNLVMYRGLADMYVADPRFTAYYDKYRPGLAIFMRDAMHAYADAHEANS